VLLRKILYRGLQLSQLTNQRYKFVPNKSSHPKANGKKFSESYSEDRGDVVATR
jgi:hypothetical protein